MGDVCVLVSVHFGEGERVIVIFFNRFITIIEFFDYSWIVIESQNY